ncbi:Cif family virulence factor [Alicyclobacillus dauci]|uniref:SnoaL-like domain-containing protein n=1 Tax=Alicyclobacillus dauci TaxID=1475485 RepID=A0ABY6Z5Z3_9BACL|nr:hypothetical protein [Alicyclobacillus dauci]WAH38170.1 hypothetical protein NZD86_06705 [Alicyclobacillus dauci]
MSELLSDFRNFLSKYQTVWNDCDARQMSAYCSPELQVRWAYPNNRISDWGHDEACSGWEQAFASYAGKSPMWHFHEVFVTSVNENEVLAVFWVTFELNGQPTKEIALFVQTFRRESAGWQLIREYVESLPSKEHVQSSLLGTLTL